MDADSFALFGFAAARFDVDVADAADFPVSDFDAAGFDAADLAAVDFAAADFDTAVFAAPAFGVARGSFATAGFFAPPVAAVSDFAAAVRVRRGRTGGSSVLIRSPAQLTLATCI